MPSIVEYTDQEAPVNELPTRIVSPLRSSPCCFVEMEEVGEPQREGRWLYRYKRCHQCGFTVRLIIQQLPDEALQAQLREMFRTTLSRAFPD